MSIPFFVVTCSDTRNVANDESGRVIREAIEKAGHVLAGSRLVPDEIADIRASLDEAIASKARVLVMTGGTGICRRDVTPEALKGCFEKELPGFGELFRYLSFLEIGSAAMLSRATAGIVSGLVVFALPGSPRAVRLAMERLILPEVAHIVRELTR